MPINLIFVCDSPLELFLFTEKFLIENSAVRIGSIVIDQSWCCVNSSLAAAVNHGNDMASMNLSGS